MNNPFKIIGISFVLSILGVYGLFELPKTLTHFHQSGWLSAMALIALGIVLILINMMSNARQLSRKIQIKSNH
ncbi:MAG: hypothetical protein IT256_00425 [Chitinophagaceae bacterium]|nr:hypothetical protein [Chitinophagaceae bacterium]